MLGWPRHAPALPPLATLAREDIHAEVRRAAVGALGFTQDDGMLPTLLQTLEEEHWQVREEAALTLREVGGLAEVAVLEAALQDGDPEVRKSARIALAQIGELVTVRTAANPTGNHSSAIPSEASFES
jgi:HEAT repeat protein